MMDTQMEAYKAKGAQNDRVYLVGQILSGLCVNATPKSTAAWCMAAVDKAVRLADMAIDRMDR